MKPGEAPNVVVIGASAGGVSALQELVSALPEDLDAAILIVLHVLAEAESFLPHILARAGRLPAAHARDGELLETGRIYVAPPDRHVLVHNSALRVVRGPKENRHRPAIDVLFRSAAMSGGERVLGVLLTGADDDGAAGLKSIQERGGTTIVQDPLDAEHPEMPASALRVIEPDFRLPLRQIGPMISSLVAGQVETKEKVVMPEPADKAFGGDEGQEVDVTSLGTPSSFSCPDCNGTLWELQDGNLLRYRCRVGHAYSVGSMVEAQAEAVERALWEAVRVLEESASMSRRIGIKNETLRTQLFQKAEERQHHARTLRDLLVNKSQ